MPIFTLLLLKSYSPPVHMNIEKAMYTPERSPSLIRGARGQNSASIILQEEEHTNANTLNPEYDGPAKYDSPTPEELSATQKLDEGKVMGSLNESTRHAILIILFVVKFWI